MSLSYVALGDSLTIGVGSALFTPGFVQRYREMTSKKLKQPIQLTVFARSRYETKDLIRLLKDERLRTELRAAHMITLTIGGNDFIHANEMYKKDSNEMAFIDALEKTKQNISKIIYSIHILKEDNSHPYIIRIPNIPCSNLEKPVPKKWIEQYNQHLETFNNDRNIKIIDLYNQFKTNPKKYLTFDGKQLNDEGYQELVNLLMQSGCGRIVH